MRVSLFCADTDNLRWGSAHLRNLGLHVYSCSSTRELVFLAERCDVLLVMSDGADPEQLAMALREIEKTQVTLLVVGDQDLPWTPSPREGVVVAPARFLEWRAPDVELPFTD